ncbi:fimbrillin family protein [Proteiniphilum sp. UBA5384]|uniref:fimbrillin family protein n=1 Tax=Proteiniphilum sp. UBA5384 TaxID=1947279 RepID=UPI0025D52EBF|nr:fimbrillin family protein [Proteiniphilum sp. UBA5384]
MRLQSISKIYKSLLGGALFALLATGCTSEDFGSPSTNDKDAVILSAGTFSADLRSTTRAANNEWEAGDLIGVTMLGTSTPATPIYTNREYQAVSAGSGSVAFNPESEGQKMYYPINGSDVTFKAYYPYTGLPAYPEYNLDVSGQSDLAKLDLMTAEHKNSDNTAVNSKDKKEAHLVFHHRMTMIIVNLAAESPIDLTDSKLVLKGMKTAAKYNLATDVLTPDATSMQDIIVPLSPSHTGQAILLPRAAAAGVAFEVTTADGGVYTAALPSDQDLSGGTKYTFNLTLKTTPTLITASIEDWIDGPTRDYDVVNIIAGTGTNAGFENGAELKLYTLDEGETSYSDGGTFTFDGSKWTRSGGLLYWESFTGPTVDFKATSTFAPALNAAQVADYLVAATPDVPLYTGLHLEMEHVGAKATIKLSSSDGTYSAADLDGATVTLPGYRNAYDFDAATVTYTTAAVTGDITPEKQGTGTPKERVAILPPQTIAADVTIVKVVINGHIYEVKADPAFTYEAGKRHELRLDITKSGVEITVSLKDWEDGDDYEAEVKIGTPKGSATNENLEDGDKLYLFTEESGTRSAVRGYFEYNAGTWAFSTPGDPLFWEELPDNGKFYAQMERDAVNATVSYNQSKDYIVATPVDNYGGTGATGTRIDFAMEHATSQVQVVLRTSDTYTAEQLKAAIITLPGYAIGGSLDKGVYVPGTNRGDIRLDEPNNTEISTRTYLQPQRIATGQEVVRVTIPGSVTPSGTDRTYHVTYNHDVEYNAGEITHLFITIKGADVLVSVKVTPWEDQTPVELSYSFDESPTNVDGFEDGDEITFYRLDGSGKVVDSKVYVVTTVGGKKELEPKDGTPWYRDDFGTGDKIVAVYPDGTRTNVPAGDNTFDVDMTGKSDPTNRENDIQVASDGVIKDKNANVDLTFEHALSKVTVNIIPGAGFAPGEITAGNPLVELIQFMQKGTVDITNGNVSGLNTPEDFAPTSIPPTGMVELSYSALILPQKKDANTTLVKITLNGIEYEAKYPSDFTFEPGKNHVLDITLAKTELKLSAKIAEWQPGTNGTITID